MATKPVNGADALMAALETAKAGTTIELAPGNYGRLSIAVPYGDAWGSFDGEVTIRSADPGNPATFTSIFMRGVENLTIDGVTVDYSTPPGLSLKQKEIDTAVWVQDSANVTIRNSVLDGDVLDDPGSDMHGLPIGKGLLVRESEGIVIEDSEFLSWHRGGLFQNTAGLVVSGNDVHTIRSDGFDFVAVQDVVIQGNYLHDFVTKAGAKDHRDMIQFWSAGARAPSTDIVIRDNWLDSESGVETQSIFIRNELVDTGAAGLEMFYRNLVIENNVIYNGHLHGITVGQTDGLRIANNTLLHNVDAGDDGGISRPRILVSKDARNVTLTKNIAEEVAGPGAVDNLIVQNRTPDGPNYYGDLFVNALAGSAGTGLSDLKGLSGGVIERGGYGSTLPSGGEAPQPSPQPSPQPAPQPAPPPVQGQEPPEPEPEPMPDPAPEPALTPDPGSGDVGFTLALAYDDGRVVDNNLTDGEVLALDALDDGRVTLVATPSDGVGSVRLNLAGVHQQVENVAPYALFGDTNGDFKQGTALAAGDYEAVLTAYSGSGGTGSVLGSETISFSVADQPASAPNPGLDASPEPAPSQDSGSLLRWNAGTQTVAAVDGGPDWVADPGAVVGSARAWASPIASSGTLDPSVPGTTPAGLFAHELWGSSKSAGLGLELGDGTLAAGTYAVRLYMGNGFSGTDGAGERVFDVEVEDQLFLDDLDLSGTLGHKVGGMFEWRGEVSDGTVDIDFVHGVDNPLINGVEIVRLDDGDLIA